MEENKDYFLIKASSIDKRKSWDLFNTCKELINGELEEFE